MTSDAWALWWRKSGEAGLRQLLMTEWDPIGVADYPEAADEYDSYVLRVGGKLRAGASADEIAGFLTHVRRDLMGLFSHAEADRAAADRIHDWYRATSRDREAFGAQEGHASEPDAPTTS